MVILITLVSNLRKLVLEGIFIYKCDKHLTVSSNLVKPPSYVPEGFSAISIIKLPQKFDPNLS